jgi:hypothetical protein
MCYGSGTEDRMARKKTKPTRKVARKRSAPKRATAKAGKKPPRAAAATEGVTGKAADLLRAWGPSRYSTR